MFNLVRRSALAALALLAMSATAHAAGADPNKLFPDSRVVVRDRFSDEIVGKGPDLVFIPGLSSSRATWKATAERLKGKYRLHLIQVAGFAGEPARANATGDVLVPTAEAIDAYLVQQKLTPATVIGHSLGGTMVLYLAEHHPEHLKKALMVDSLPFFGVVQGRPNPAATVDSLRPMATQLRDAMVKGGPAYDANIERAVKGMVTGQADVDMVIAWGKASDPSVVGRAMYDDLQLDLRPGLAALQTPMTLVFPDNVPNGAPPGVMEKFYPVLYAGAKTVTFKAVGPSKHFVMLDQPAAFAAALDAFLAS